jgi:hypothetical protein
VVTALFVMSSVGSSTRGLESFLEIVGRSILGWVGLIGSGVFPVCVIGGYPIVLVTVSCVLWHSFNVTGDLIGGMYTCLP